MNTSIAAIFATILVSGHSQHHTESSKGHDPNQIAIAQCMVSKVDDLMPGQVQVDYFGSTNVSGVTVLTDNLWLSDDQVYPIPNSSKGYQIGSRNELTFQPSESTLQEEDIQIWGFVTTYTVLRTRYASPVVTRPPQSPWEAALLDAAKTCIGELSRRGK